MMINQLVSENFIYIIYIKELKSNFSKVKFYFQSYVDKLDKMSYDHHTFDKLRDRIRKPYLIINKGRNSISISY